MEDKALALESARRALLLANGDSSRASQRDWESLKEEIIIAHLVRKDVETTIMEIEESGRIVLTVLIAGTNTFKKFELKE